MCKSNTYNKGTTGVQQGVLNVWFSSQGLPWLFVGVLLVVCLWGMLGCHSCLKKRKRRHALQDTNLQLTNQKLGSSTPYFAASLAAMPPPLPMPYGVTQPFITPSVPAPLVGGAPPYGDQNYRVVTLALNKPLV